MRSYLRSIENLIQKWYVVFEMPWGFSFHMDMVLGIKIIRKHQTEKLNEDEDREKDRESLAEDEKETH